MVVTSSKPTSNKDETASNSPALELNCSQQFVGWLYQEQISLAFTTYQSSRLILLGIGQEGRFSGFERNFNRAMGLYTVGSERFYLSSKYQLWQFDNVLSPGQNYQGYDKLYVPRTGYTTGDLDIHDVAVDSGGRIVFVSTLLNCLATVSESNSCTPLWKPSFISKVVNEDRCHLNGMAMVDGKPRYVTAVAQTDVKDAWREKRRNGGCVIDVTSNEVILSGLSMPHSPRFYQGKLWLMNSGTGEFGYVDLERGSFEVVAFCPGYLRGLAFWKQWAIIGLSKPRGEDKTFSGLALDERLTEKGEEARCGLMVVDINTGEIVHSVSVSGVIRELYDVQILPQVRRPMALGFQNDEISTLLTLDSMSEL